MSIRKILIKDLELYSGGFQEFTDCIIKDIRKNFDFKLIIVHVNLRNYYFLYKDKNFKEAIRKSCICVFDGIGMKTGLALRGYSFIRDLNGTDLFPFFIKEFITLGYGIFILGAGRDTIINAAKKIKEEYPQLRLQGYHHGYFTKDEENDIVKKINDSKSDILIIGMGFPLQEKFALKYKGDLHVSIIWNAGGLLDFLSGSKPRAPLLIRKIRLEWLYRFLLEPGRMLHRNTVAAFWSLLHVIKNTKGVS